VVATIATNTLTFGSLPAAGGAAASGQVGGHLRGQRIYVTTTTCAPRWYAPNPGRAHFAITNRSAYSATIYLFHPRSNAIVATVKHLKPHSVRELVVTLARGRRYVWGCDLTGRPSRVSDVQTVPVDPNHGGPGPPVVPVTRGELTPAMRSYRAYVVHEFALLTSQTNALETDLAGDDVADAKTAWLTAHLTWLRIGQDDGAYSAFGTLGRTIDGTTAGLVGGTSSPRFTGFHKVEYDLWARADIAAATTDAKALARAVSRLTTPPISQWLPLTTAGVSGLPLRCHEILEDALRDSLTGQDDYGSGTSLASVRADVAGTRELLGLLAQLIRPRSSHLVSHARKALTRLAAAVNATRAKSGAWVAVADLPRRSRDAVDSAVGRVLNILAPVPDLLTIGKS
jgi:high-affinity iron transporter